MIAMLGMALGAPEARAQSALYECVNNSSGTVKVITTPGPCHTTKRFTP